MQWVDGGGLGQKRLQGQGQGLQQQKQQQQAAAMATMTPLLKYKLSPNWRPPFLPVAPSCGSIAVRRVNDAQIMVTVLVRMVVCPDVQVRS